VVLSGTFRQMGRQYGGLLSGKIKEFYKELHAEFIKSGSFTEKQIADYIVKPASLNYNKRYSEFIRGVSETAGLDEGKIIITNENILMTLFSRKLKGGNVTSCTSIATWGSYTKDGTVITARDFDFPSFYRELFKKYGNFVIMKPVDGSNVISGIGYAGSINFSDIMNGKGIYTQFNNGAGSEGIIIYSNRGNVLADAVNLLFDCDTIAAYEVRMRAIRANIPTIMMGADKTSARYFENGTSALHVRNASQEGIIGAANQFLDPEWGIIPVPSPAIWYSEQRRENMMKAVESQKGNIDETVMMSLMDRKLYDKNGIVSDGFAVFEKQPHDDEVTVYQIVTSPQRLVWWLRVPTFTGWLKFDLDKLVK
jgi:hypothetical protein